jgi:hypothetical protein
MAGSIKQLVNTLRGTPYYAEVPEDSLLPGGDRLGLLSFSVIFIALHFFSYQWYFTYDIILAFLKY